MHVIRSERNYIDEVEISRCQMNCLRENQNNANPMFLEKRRSYFKPTAETNTRKNIELDNRDLMKDRGILSWMNDASWYYLSVHGVGVARE